MAPTFAEQEESSDQGQGSGANVSSDSESLDSYHDNNLDLAKVNSTQSDQLVVATPEQEMTASVPNPLIAPVNEMNPLIVVTEMNPNRARSLTGERPRQAFNTHMEGRSLFRYFSSSRNAEDGGPLEHRQSLNISEDLHIQRQRVPVATVTAEPIMASDPSVRTSSMPINCIQPRRRSRPLEVPLSIRESNNTVDRRASLEPLGKGKEVIEEKRKAKKVRKSNTINGPGEGTGSTRSAFQSRPSTPSGSTRIIHEDGSEYVNCSDEETMFVLSDDDFEKVPTAPLPNPILRRKQYEASRKFQETWAARLPWVEMTRSEDGLIEGVKCLICSAVERRNKLLKAKHDTLTKHAGRRKALKDIKGVAKKGDWYYTKDCAHAKNAVLYAARGPQTVHQLVQNESGEQACKRVQFATIFHVLSNGRPMTEYESLQSLLNFFNVSHMPKKHWTDNSGWQMAEVMHAQVNANMKEVIKNANYLAVTCDEVTSIDNTSWICIHIYTQQVWTRTPMLLSLQHVQVCHLYVCCIF